MKTMPRSKTKLSDKTHQIKDDMAVSKKPTITRKPTIKTKMQPNKKREAPKVEDNAKKIKLAAALNVPESEGVVLTVGQGIVGQLGLGPDCAECSRPSHVKALSRIVAVSAGGMHTVCLDRDGKVITFGCNDESALGRDTSVEDSEFEPGPVDLPSKAVQISAGDSHTAALLEDGQVYAWGTFRDIHGCMGLTVNGTERSPVPIYSGKDPVIKISSGNHHIVMLTKSGQVFTCGCAEHGQLGRVPERWADRSSRKGVNWLLTPEAIKFKSKRMRFVDSWAQSCSTFLKTKEGAIYACGLNNYYQLGLPGMEVRFQPELCRTFLGKQWADISCGLHHTMALESTGIVHVLGRKEYGRLGLGKDAEETKFPTPVTALQSMKCKAISCGESVSFAVTEDGKVYGWGFGTNGQLGLADDEDAWDPQLMLGKQLQNRKVLSVSAGGQHTVLLVADL